jgi:hypothetical protein
MVLRSDFEGDEMNKKLTASQKAKIAELASVYEITAVEMVCRTACITMDFAGEIVIAFIGPRGKVTNV